MKRYYEITVKVESPDWHGFLDYCDEALDEDYSPEDVIAMSIKRKIQAHGDVMVASIEEKFTGDF